MYPDFGQIKRAEDLVSGISCPLCLSQRECVARQPGRSLGVHYSGACHALAWRRFRIVNNEGHRQGTRKGSPPVGSRSFARQHEQYDSWFSTQKSDSTHLAKGLFECASRDPLRRRKVLLGRDGAVHLGSPGGASGPRGRWRTRECRDVQSGRRHPTNWRTGCIP